MYRSNIGIKVATLSYIFTGTLVVWIVFLLSIQVFVYVLAPPTVMILKLAEVLIHTKS